MSKGFILSHTYETYEYSFAISSALALKQKISKKYCNILGSDFNGCKIPQGIFSINKSL